MGRFAWWNVALVAVGASIVIGAVVTAASPFLVAVGLAILGLPAARLRWPEPARMPDREAVELALAREEYATGAISLSMFEWRVGRILRGETRGGYPSFYNLAFAPRPPLDPFADSFSSALTDSMTAPICGGGAGAPVALIPRRDA